MTDDELWALVVAAEKAMDQALFALQSVSDDEDLAQRAALRDRSAEKMLAFTRLTNQWQKRLRSES